VAPSPCLKLCLYQAINDDRKTLTGQTPSNLLHNVDCTEIQMMAMFGWTDPKMPAHYIAKANREKLGMSVMDKVVAFDQSQSLDDFMPVAAENSGATLQANKVVTLRSNFGKKTL
jgi:hypothetical protein